MSTQDALDMMAADIMGKKEAKAAKLTPVGVERRSETLYLKKDEPVTFIGPVVTPDELASVLDQMKLAERTLRNAQQAVATLYWRQHNGQEPPPELDEGAVIAAARKVFPDAIVVDEAGEMPMSEFEEKYAAMQQAAQAAVFSGSPQAGWECPTHGDAGLEDRTSRKGRSYRACTQCEEFEK